MPSYWQHILPFRKVSSEISGVKNGSGKNCLLGRGNHLVWKSSQGDICFLFYWLFLPFVQYFHEQPREFELYPNSEEESFTLSDHLEKYSQ
jgi:hypothetical protein